ncbi:MAG: carboxylesterase/lipase family protein [Candidatus Brocadiia bacterium]
MKRTVLLSLLVLLYAPALVVLSEDAANPALPNDIITEYGPISGVVQADGVRIFKGIPFAAPPVGELRWKPPQPAKKWDKIRPCVEFGPWCIQPKQEVFGREESPQSEDCLYLNVWTSAQSKDERRPVMVWIHGGGFTTGSGSMKVYDGQTYARRGIVLVTINYRVGPLGFFAHPLLSKESEKGSSGNYGFLDQVESLKWVQRNIAAFGGDPNCVTIFGESAGAVSVGLHLVSPLSRGLFHRAILESGSSDFISRKLKAETNGLESSEASGERLASQLKCDAAPDVLSALRAIPAEEILRAANPSQGLFGDRKAKYGPVIDGWVIPDLPDKMMQEGKMAPVPVMVGTNSDEGTIFLSQLPVKTVAGYQILMKTLFKDNAEELLKLFPAKEDSDVAMAINKFSTVAFFVVGARTTARKAAKLQPQVFMYHFTRSFPRLGAFHAAEIPYVFGNLPAAMANPQVDAALSQTMNSFWINFALSGDPNGQGLPKWPVYTETEDKNIELGEQIKESAGLWRTECDLFDKIFAALRAKQ